MNYTFLHKTHIPKLNHLQAVEALKSKGTKTRFHGGLDVPRTDK